MTHRTEQPESLQVMKADAEEIKTLADKYVGVITQHFKGVSGDVAKVGQKEVARQMMTAFASLAMAMDAVRDQAHSLGIHIGCVNMTEDEIKNFQGPKEFGH